MRVVFDVGKVAKVWSAAGVLLFLTAVALGQNSKPDDALLSEAKQQYVDGKLVDAEQGFAELALGKRSIVRR
jgi:hypothetical protein